MSLYYLWSLTCPGKWSRDLKPPVFVSPNVSGIPPDKNHQVYAAYERSLKC